MQVAEPLVIRLGDEPVTQGFYRNGAYDDLDYAADLDPPLGPEDAAWARELLRAKGLLG